jgi:hypothetical protein
MNNRMGAGAIGSGNRLLIPMASPRKTIKRGPGQRMPDGKSFRLADEVRYIQRRAANHTGRFVTISQLALFSTEAGDSRLLNIFDRLAAPLGRDGVPEPIHIEETDTTFAIVLINYAEIVVSVAPQIAVPR